MQSKILGMGRSEAWGGGAGLCRRCWWPKKLWNNMRTPHVPLTLGFLEPFLQRRKILSFCNCWGAKVWYFQTLEIGIRSPKTVCQWFWPSKTSSCRKMGMHVYIPFFCLRCLALLANLLIFGESRDVFQLKVVGEAVDAPILRRFDSEIWRSLCLLSRLTAGIPPKTRWAPRKKVVWQFIRFNSPT